MSGRNGSESPGLFEAEEAHDELNARMFAECMELKSGREKTAMGREKSDCMSMSLLGRSEG